MLKLNLTKTLDLASKTGPLPFLSACNFSRLAKCAPSEGPPCGEEALKKKDCKKQVIPSWVEPECCIKECKDAPARFDDLYYKPSDKTRKYLRTWAECPKLVICPMVVCETDMAKYLPLETRKTRREGEKLVEVPLTKKLMMMCENKSTTKCAKAYWPTCPPARDPPKCLPVAIPSKCKKRCTPYPSFSECKKPKKRPLPPVECNCLKIGPLCQYTQLKKEKSAKSE